MFLWEKTAFGPIYSRRLGSSLGINISPNDVKICSFDCIYCECGWTLEKSITPDHFASAEELIGHIAQKLQLCHQAGTSIDSITFSGNGEPTLHPQFEEIINELLLLRDKYYPRAIITCLTNSTRLQDPAVARALRKIENPMFKLDAGNEELFQLINRPTVPITLKETVAALQAFKGQGTLQTLFFKGEIEGTPFDNSTPEHVALWIEIVKTVEPKRVAIYSLDRETPAQQLIKIYKKDLEPIAEQVRALGIETAVYE